MSQNNTQLQRVKFSDAIQQVNYKQLINNTLGDAKKSERFIASVTSAVAVNKDLQECTPHTIIASALLGESLELSPSPQLGHYYMMPFNDRKNNCKNATFVLGYKGYIQLAIRSGQYKKLNVLEIKEGELVHFNPLDEEIECNIIQDFEEREKAETIGYYASFEYINGFKKAIYWSKSKMIQHADKYSPAFNQVDYFRINNGDVSDRDMWRYSSFWYKNFDAMAKKTMLRQLISKWGVMSIDMQTAFTGDNNVIDTNGNPIPMEYEEPAPIAPAPQVVSLDDI